jgi:hypothetical protein
VNFQKLVAAILLAVTLMGTNETIASTINDRDAAIDAVRLKTDLGTLTGSQEVKEIEKIWKDYYKEHPPKTFHFGVGQALFNDVFPVTTFLSGTEGIITFEFIDTETLTPLTGGPTVGSVLYQVNLDPQTPTIYTAIGTSTDAASHFALPYALGANEPFIRATPFDLSGNPIVFTDIDGVGNVAVGDVVNIEVPEPSTLTVSSLLLVMFGFGALRKRLRGTKTAA